jgi:hypothetical protein
VIVDIVEVLCGTVRRATSSEEVVVVCSQRRSMIVIDGTSCAIYHHIHKLINIFVIISQQFAVSFRNQWHVHPDDFEHCPPVILVVVSLAGKRDALDHIDSHPELAGEFAVLAYTGDQHEQPTFDDPDFIPNIYSFQLKLVYYGIRSMLCGAS